MYRINLNSRRGIQILKSLITKRWNDNSNARIPLVVIKVSEAFSMYHQIVSDELFVHNRALLGFHPILINDLDTNVNVFLLMNQDGIILHFDLLDDEGRLHRCDDLRKIASRTVHQEYLDYFYCIAKNVENYVNVKHP